MEKGAEPVFCGGAGYDSAALGSGGTGVACIMSCSQLSTLVSESMTQSAMARYLALLIPASYPRFVMSAASNNPFCSLLLVRDELRGPRSAQQA